MRTSVVGCSRRLDILVRVNEINALLSIDELASAGPYVNADLGDVDATIVTTEALGDLEDFDENELEAAAQEWVESPEGEAFIADLPWDIVDPRFRHARRVTDFEITAIRFEAADEQSIDVSVDVKESQDGFDERVAAERAAL